MSAQSDRIRAALQRSETTRESGEPRPGPAEQVKIAVNDENLAVLLGPKAPSHEPPKVPSHDPPKAPSREPLNAPSDDQPKALSHEPPVMKPPVMEPPHAAVETTLPLIAASDQKRAAPSRFETTLPPKVKKVEAPAADLEAPIAKLETPPTTLETPPVSGSPRIMLMVVGLAIALAGLAAFLLRNHWSSPKQSAQTAPAGLQVKVEPQSNGLINVRWNPQSGLVTQAREGRLVISEPDQQPRTVALNSEQLKSGHVYYQSSADRIEFRLQVIDGSGAMAEESVLALSSKPAAAPPLEPPSPAARAASAPTAVQNAPNAAASANPPQVTDVPENPQPSRPAARPFTPPQSKQPSPGSASTISLDPPAPVANGDVIPSGVGLADRLNGVPQPQVVTPRINVGGNVQSAKLIKKVTPVYPALAKVARAHGSVRFTATVGKDGRIKNLQLLSGNPTLVPAATEAVKQWVYEPTLLNGEPIEVITQIEVNFSMSQ